ncbi:MAG: flagellin lysine-N-methylase [Oscillospiraceae bacterium]|nr:flagellin lysine-N-methylase [Oscillospiraceae bacterium]
MKHLAPACFRAFACAAGSCPDSCCRAGWEIIPDDDTIQLYNTLSGPDGERVREGILPGTEPLLRQDERRVCVLLDPDGLCCVQRHFGHGALCRVCREYPRFHREFGNLTEHGLSLSCPTAYALATGASPAWEEWEDEAPIVPNELDPAAYLRLRKGRALALALLAREALPLQARLRLLHRLAAAMQGAPELRISHNYEARLRRWTTLPPSRRDKHGLSLHPEKKGAADCGALARRFLDLEILSPEWRDALERFAALAAAGRLPGPLPPPGDPEPYARWLWYELYKYWLDALDDGRLLARAERSLAMLLLGLAMDRALPGEGPFLRRISREIEHCEENLESLLDPALGKLVRDVLG